MKIRFYVDPETDAPHIHNHDVDEDEVADVLVSPGGRTERAEKDHASRLDERAVGVTCAWSMCLMPSRPASSCSPHTS